ncbi:unnamed protein product [Orchesella dallaii]|uniref:AN1-type domain-containing protein n=1 Tax=Orchesella dallaii TaxID=48710 RepID=A0ABP1RDB9_9HEXA
MELPDIGKQCAHEECQQLDFLPAACAHCSKTFCKYHLSPFVHPCQGFKDNVLTDSDLAEKERERWQVKCSFSDCSKKDMVPMYCVKCNQHFCLSHRHADQHSCKVQNSEKAKALVSGKKADNSSKAVKEVQGKIKEDINAKLEEARASGGSKGAMAAKLQLMRLKGRAKGDNAVPQAERVFFSIACPHPQQNPKPLDVWMSKVWSLGKAVDFMARQARVKNRNNQADAPKLHFFKEEVCLSETFDKTINDLLNEGAIFDGDSLEFKLVEKQ